MLHCSIRGGACAPRGRGGQFPALRKAPARRHRPGGHRSATPWRRPPLQRRRASRRTGAGGPRPAGRRLARRLHLGRARPPAGGALAEHRRHLRHLGRRHERRRAGRRPSPRAAPRARATRSTTSGSASRTRRASARFAARPARHAARAAGRSTTRRLFMAIDLMSRAVLALRPQSAAAQPAARRSWPRASTSSGSPQAPIKLFVTATNVRTGRGRVFRNAEITPDVLLASACLPTMFQAVEIDGEPYWDGGYRRQPDDDAADPRMRLGRHHPGPDQPDRAPRHAAHRARHPQPAERDLLQRRRC